MKEVFKQYYAHEFDEGSSLIIIRRHGEAKEVGHTVTAKTTATGGYAYVSERGISFHCPEALEGLVMEFAVNNGFI